VKIVYIIDYLYSVNGGTERQLYMLLDGMVSRGHDVGLYVFKHTDFTKNLVDFPCPIHCLNVDSLASIACFRSLYKFRQLMIAKHVDVVHGYFNDVALILPPLMIGAGINTYTSRRDMGIWYTPLRLWILRLFRFTKTRLICNSHAVARFTHVKEWKSLDAFTVIYNGIEPLDPTKASGLSNWAPERAEGTVNVVLVANIRPVKRIEDLIMAAKHLMDGQINVEYYLIGHLSDPGYCDSLIKLLHQYNLENRFHFIGTVSEPRLSLDRFDIGVLTSESEGLSNSIMEYLDAGLPVVVSNVGGNPELVIDGLNGFLYEVGDYKVLADCIRKLVNNNFLRKEISANSKANGIRGQFERLTMISRHEEEYYKVCKYA